jgi:type IV fimbrial biogenesis protein FimT
MDAIHARGGPLRGPNLKRRQNAFTLIELSVTVAVLGTVMALALPRLSATVSHNHMRSVRDEFTSAVGRMRTEAIHRNRCVSMCISSNAKTCNQGTNTNWSAGWLMYQNQSCGALEGASIPSGDIIAASQSIPTHFDLRSNSTGSRSAFSANARGVLLVNAGTFTLRDTRQPCQPSTTMTISWQGRVRLDEVPSTSCP